MYLLRLFFIALVAFSIAHPASAAKQNPRYASIVIDMETGNVLHQRYANEKRYPASLTKMMTMYMTFDALNKGKIRLSDRMTASKNAAAQPQTNISLRAGDKITVDQALRALVTRSANDASVVLAEHLGKSTWNFALMSTNKARALGMKNTVFRNPNGLPDPRQYTTAADMAKLGMALRRDFPQYYHYFNVKNFAYKGRNYPTHNNVLYRFKGANGIKTGYIRASGFNLVSTVERDEHRVVAVVMGGVTAGSRDNHMVDLLGQAFARLEKQGDNIQYASAPVPTIKPDVAKAEPVTLQLASADETKPAASPARSMQDIIVVRDAPVAEPKVSVQVDTSKQAVAKPTLFSVALSTDPEVKTAALVEPAAGKKQAATDSKPSIDRIDITPVNAVIPEYTASASKEAAGTPKPGTLDYQLAMLSGQTFPIPTARASNEDRRWGIQVGAFSSAEQAREAVNSAARNARTPLQNAAVAIASEGAAHNAIHRARLGNLTRTEAADACRMLSTARQACFPLQLN